MALLGALEISRDYWQVLTRGLGRTVQGGQVQQLNGLQASFADVCTLEGRQDWPSNSCCLFLWQTSANHRG